MYFLLNNFLNKCLIVLTISNLKNMNCLRYSKKYRGRLERRRPEDFILAITLKYREERHSFLKITLLILDPHLNYNLEQRGEAIFLCDCNC